jgi:hypothetical protein
MANVKQAAKSGAAPAAPAAPAPEPVKASDIVQELKVTGHMMALPTGLFCIVNEPHPTSMQNGGLPGVRISPPPSNAQNVEITGFRADGWLSAEGDATLVRVRKGPAHVLVTIYQLPNQPDAAPKLQVRQLLGGGDADQAANPAQSVPAAQQERMDLLAHIQTRGDVGAKFGKWLGEQGSNNWIEGFAIAAPDGIDPEDFTYQGVLGRGWLSPWVEAGQYCGSRGMALPLLGLRVRLTGAAAEQYDISVEASFVGGETAGPVGNDETCEGETLAPLEALQVTLTPRTRKTGKAKR